MDLMFLIPSTSIIIYSCFTIVGSGFSPYFFRHRACKDSENTECGKRYYLKVRCQHLGFNLFGLQVTEQPFKSTIKSFRVFPVGEVGDEVLPQFDA